MSLLLDRLPDTVTIRGQPVPIQTGFRYGILFEMLCLDNSLDSVTKSEKALRLMYPDLTLLPLEEPQQIVDALLWFFRGGDRPLNRHQINERHKADGGKGNGAERVYDYAFDDELIYAAFLQQYHIDLTRTDLHWWQFRALFYGLTEDTKFVKVMGYRAAKVTNQMSSAEKRQLLRMKEVYALPVPKDELDKENAIADALQSGNVRAIMEILAGGDGHG